MTSLQSTSAPPSIRLALMALHLAGHRKWGMQEPFAEGALPLSRANACPIANELSVEYYAVIDRISRGEQP